LNALFMFAMIFSNLLFPIFSRMFARNIDVKPLLATSSKLLVGGSIMLALICYYNSEFILALIYNSGIQESNVSFQLLMFSFIGMCSSIIFGTILTAKGSMLFLNVVAAIGILVNFILNFYLIPLHGASGAAIATFLTQSLVSCTQFLYCAYKLKLQFTPLSSSLFLLFVGCIWSICFFVRAESLLVLLALISVSFVAMILFRLIDLRKLRIILKSSSEEEYMTE
jgi:O-antigen/teichoic acid export membrane protein